MTYDQARKKIKEALGGRWESVAITRRERYGEQNGEPLECEVRYTVFWMMDDMNGECEVSDTLDDAVCRALLAIEAAKVRP